MNLTISKINFYHSADCKPCKMEAMTMGAASLQAKIQAQYGQTIEINFIDGDKEGDEYGQPLKVSPHIVFFDSQGRVRIVVNGFPLLENVPIESTELIEYVLMDAIINVDAAEGPNTEKAQNLDKILALKAETSNFLMEKLGSAKVTFKEGS